MATYQYRARDKTGKLLQGVIEADTEALAATRLQQMEYLPVSIAQARKEGQAQRIFGGGRVKFADLNLFTRQLFTLQKAGVPLIASLNSLKTQSSNKTFQNIIGQVIKDIEGGTTLSGAFERHPQVFNALYVSMIKTGEASGKLEETLQRVAILGEHEETVRMRIKAAMRYPFIVVCAIIIGFFILITVVMPRFAKIYGQFNTVLPLPTRILLGINYITTHFWWLILIFVVVLIFALQQFLRSKTGIFWWDNIKLNLPVFGPLFQKMTMSRFCRITGTLSQSGVPILQILELVSNSLDNVIISRTINNIKTSVSEGRGMSEPIKSSGMFPPIVVQMIAVGEETGRIDELLLYVADYYDLEVDNTIQNLVSLIEPMLILVLGVAVLFMALGVFLPMWNMMNLFTAR